MRRLCLAWRFILVATDKQVSREKLLVLAAELLCGLSSPVPICRLHLCKQKQLLFLQMWTPRLSKSKAAETISKGLKKTLKTIFKNPKHIVTELNLRLRQS